MVELWWGVFSKENSRGISISGHLRLTRRGGKMDKIEDAFGYNEWARCLREGGHMRSDPHWSYTRSIPAISWSGLRSAESMRRAIDPSLIRRHMFELRMGRTLFFCLFDVCLCGSYGVMGGDPYRNPRHMEWVMNILRWVPTRHSASDKLWNVQNFHL